MKIQNPMSIYEKLNILSDAAKYDVACTSSGTKRKGDGSGMGNCTHKKAPVLAFPLLQSHTLFLLFLLSMHHKLQKIFL